MKNKISSIIIIFVIFNLSINGLLSINTLAVDSRYPDDFRLDAYGGGFPPWIEWYRVEIDAEGHSIYSIMYPEDRDTSDFTVIQEFELSQNEMNQLWDQIVSNDFFNLNSIYSESDIFPDTNIIISDGTFANITVIGNEIRHTVETRHIGVPNFDKIITTLNDLTPTDNDLYYHGLFNIPPLRPPYISGPTNGKIREEYSYTTKAMDTDFDDLYYKFNWGDDTYSDWIGPYESNNNISVKHEWTSKSSYNISVQAKDDPNGDGVLSDGIESGWSDPLTVSMPINKISYSKLIMLLEKVVDKFFIFEIFLNDIISLFLPKLILNNNVETPFPTEVKEPGPNDCIIKIILRIQIWGGGASNETADKIKKDIENKYAGDWKYKCKLEECNETEPGCDVKFEIIVKYDWKNQTSRPPKGNGYHPWYIGNDPTGKECYNQVYCIDTNKNDNIVDYPRPNDRTSTFGSTINNGCADGYMDNNEPAGTYAHEAGHLLGLDDKYVAEAGTDEDNSGSVDPDERNTKPKKGHENDIMATLGGTMQQWAVDKIIERAKVKCPCRCCPKQDNKKPENKIQNHADGDDVYNPLYIIGYADDGYDGSGVALLDYSLEWDGGSYDGGEYEIDPPQRYIEYELGPIYLENFIEPGDSITIATYATDAAGNTGEDSVTVTWDAGEDNTPPITKKIIGEPNENGGYSIWPITPIIFESTDDLSGVNYIHYDIWWDSDGDMIIDMQMASETIYGDTTTFSVVEYGILFGLIELNWYAVDNEDNHEDIHNQEHFVNEG